MLIIKIMTTDLNIKEDKSKIENDLAPVKRKGFKGKMYVHMFKAFSLYSLTGAYIFHCHFFFKLISEWL